VNVVTQTEFDQLATFVAVAEELSMEPFLSEDNHERLVLLKESTGGPDVSAYFCHPAFLKSAVLPFRKLWLPSEICAFEKIRDLVFRVYPDQKLVAGYHHWFYDAYSRQLDEPAAKEWADESRRDILNIWIYTQAIHVGKRQTEKGKIFGQYTLRDFDQWAERIGREKFEYLFRGSLRSVGYLYVQFLEKLAAPLFVSFKHEMKPGFEASAALKYNPYPDPRYWITFDDVFWHIDKESVEETFDRLLARQSYSALQSFLRGYFESKPDALAAVCGDASFSAMLERTGAVLLTENQNIQDQLLIRHASGWGSSRFGAVAFEVYAGRKVRLEQSERVFAEIYADFRKCFFEERRRQRREPWKQ